MLRALDRVDSMKSQKPMLGSPVTPDWKSALLKRMPEQGLTLEEVIPKLVEHLEGMFIWGHPRSQINVVAPPSIASIIGVVLPSTYNPNLASEESSRGVAVAEVEVSSITADLIGYSPEQAGGIFTFGGTGAMLYGAKVGLEKAIPGCLNNGLREDAVIIASGQSHYACLNVAGWLGLGQKQVLKVPTHQDNSLKLTELERTLRQVIESKTKIAAIVATMGTTDAFGIDDLRGIYGLREHLVQEYELDYVPHIHADAVIGWAWSVFNEYDYEENLLEFRGRTLRALAAANYRIRHLHLADSLGIDFHKTGYTPYVSTLVLFRDRKDLSLIERSRAEMPYLFQSGEYHPGRYTLETTRSGLGPMSAFANLVQFGREGLQVLLGHAVETAEMLREELESHPYMTVLNGENVGPVTLFRVYPDGVDTFTIKDRERQDPKYREQLHAYNRYNHEIYQRVHGLALEGQGVVLSKTDCYRPTDYGEPIVALKSYILSPFSDQSEAKSVVDQVLAAREFLKESTHDQAPE